MNTVVGIDFDNTIIFYDPIFHCEAIQRNLIPTDFFINKEKIRNYLREQHQENAWTELQGVVYGERLTLAEPFPGILKFIHTSLDQKIKIFIISHKTQHPFLGPQFDLHQAAYEWLNLNIFPSTINRGLSRDQVHFLDTKIQKCHKISELNCTHFIDDLPEFFSEPSFPPNVTKILFAPQHEKGSISSCDVIKKSWDHIYQYFFGKQ